MNQTYDRFQPLKKEDIELIHQKTVEVLSTTGMWFESETAREVFKKHGFKVEGERVYFSEQGINDALKTVPRKFTLLAPNPARNVEIGEDSFVFGVSGGSPFTLDYETGTARTSTSKDVEECLKVVQSLEDIGLARSIVQAGDVKAENVLLYQMLMAMKLTDKPIDCPPIQGIGLLSILYGIDKEKMSEETQKGTAFGISYINPISPLGISKHETDRLMEHSRYGIALGISPMPLAGMTAPCTLPGLLVTQNCEIIGTAVLSQLVNPGCPILYGCIGTITDMKYVSGPTGTPETSIIKVAAAQLARYYGIPSRGDAGLADTNCIDFQSGAESAFQIVNAIRCGANILPGLGALSSWNIASVEKLVLDTEVVGMVKRLIKPLEFTKENLAIDVINNVGPRGTFVTETHTYQHFRTEFYNPLVFSRQPYDNWEKDGMKDARQRAHDKIVDLLDNYEAPSLDKSVEKDLEQYAERHYV